MMAFTESVAQLLDYPLGWTLALPREAAIAIVALVTSLILTLVRRFSTNQDRLKRCKQDLVRLKALLKQHRAAGDKEAIGRTKGTGTAVRLIQVRAEGLALLVSLVPIGALALWAVERLDYLPLRSGEEVTITARFAPTAIDTVAHLVPAEGVTLKSPAVQLVAADPDDPAQGKASWRIVPESAGSAERIELAIRHQRQTVKHVLRVGGTFYEPRLTQHHGGAILATEADLEQARFLGLVPGVPFLGLPPWLVAYLLLAIPLTPLVRYILRVS